MTTAPGSMVRRARSPACDHLPGLRMHQLYNGMKTEQDPRLHQVPVLIASNTDDPQQLAEAIAGRPLYCLSPLILDWVGQPADERFMNYLDASCRKAEDPKVRPAEAVIQNQLFARDPI